jgi:hypothetical protein
MKPPSFFPADARHTTRKSERGELHVWTTPGGVLLTRLSGYFSADLAPTFTTAADALFRSNARVSLFHDWDAMEDYEPSVRPQLTTWIAGYKKQLAHHHILLRSRLVALGVATAGAVLGLTGTPLTSTSDRADFEAKLRLAALR